MATYSSYRVLDPGEIADGALCDANFNADAAKNFGVQWVYGDPGNCTPGCCCLWTTPSYVQTVTFEVWGAGGNGHGACVCDRCQHFQGAAGGGYTTKTVTTCPGWQYTVCAGGVYRCNSIECSACNGCTSYVNGCNISGNFCACGGTSGNADSNWNTYCNSCSNYCRNGFDNGADFNLVPHTGPWTGGNVFCHCHNHEEMPNSAPIIGTTVVGQLRECWMRCGCWTSPYGHGGQGAMSTYCGTVCCGQGATGGSGLVKITYM